MCTIDLHAISYGVACFFARCWKLCFVCSCSLRGRRLRLPPSASFQAPFLSSLSTPILEDQNRQMQKRRRRLFWGLEGKVASTKTVRKKKIHCFFKKNFLVYSKRGNMVGHQPNEPWHFSAAEIDAIMSFLFFVAARNLFLPIEEGKVERRRRRKHKRLL